MWDPEITFFSSLLPELPHSLALFSLLPDPNPTHTQKFSWIDKSVFFSLFSFSFFGVFWGLDGSLVFYYYPHTTGTTTSCHCFFPTIRSESLKAKEEL